MLTDTKHNTPLKIIIVLLLAVPSFAGSQASFSVNGADTNRKSIALDSAGRLPENDPRIVGVGDQAPDFTLPSLNGKEISLSSYHDKTAVLWFTNLCSGCQSVLPVIESIDSAYSAWGVSVLAVSLLGDDTTTVRTIARKYDIPFPLLIDPKASIYEKYGGLMIPPGT